ncbi:MAG: HAD family hydrolase [Anaerolineales bacterium]|nr:HAD family hydrolase [Anaerolineales bacterium]
MNGITAILFDLDGTLRHNQPNSGEVFSDCVSAGFGLVLTPEDRLKAARWEHYYWAMSKEQMLDREKYKAEDLGFWLNYCRRRLVALGISAEQSAELAPTVQKYMETYYRAESVVAEHSIDMLEYLQKAGYRLGVVSNRDKPFFEELEALGLTGFLDYWMAAGEVRSWKPDPEIFLHALNEINARPEQTVYVGDNYYADVIGARNAGLKPVLYDPQEIFDDPDCTVIRSFKELPELMEIL